MDKYETAFLEVAQLAYPDLQIEYKRGHLWQVLNNVRYQLNPHETIPLEGLTLSIPEVFRLMIAYNCYPQPEYALGEVSGVTINAGKTYAVSVDYSNYSSKELALRHAIILAILKKLECQIKYDF